MMHTDEDHWETQEAAAEQLRREVAEARDQIIAADARARGRPRIHWDDDMLRVLHEMRAAGYDLYRCAERIGVGYPTAVHKARELGIAQRMSRGPIPGVVLRAGAVP